MTNEKCIILGIFMKKILMATFFMALVTTNLMVSSTPLTEEEKRFVTNSTGFEQIIKRILLEHGEASAKIYVNNLYNVFRFFERMASNLACPQGCLTEQEAKALATLQQVQKSHTMLISARSTMPPQGTDGVDVTSLAASNSQECFLSERFPLKRPDKQSLTREQVAAQAYQKEYGYPMPHVPPYAPWQITPEQNKSMNGLLVQKIGRGAPELTVRENKQGQQHCNEWFSMLPISDQLEIYGNEQISEAEAQLIRDEFCRRVFFPLTVAQKVALVREYEKNVRFHPNKFVGV